MLLAVALAFHALGIGFLQSDFWVLPALPCSQHGGGRRWFRLILSWRQRIVRDVLLVDHLPPRDVYHLQLMCSTQNTLRRSLMALGLVSQDVLV